MSQAPSWLDALATSPSGEGAGYVVPPPKEGEAPMPYSPDGWALSKMVAPAQGAAPAASGKPAEAKKKAGVGFTPEQAAALAKLTMVEPAPAPRAPGAASAPKNSVQPMQQVSAGGATPQRASLGQILYGGKR